MKYYIPTDMKYYIICSKTLKDISYLDFKTIKIVLTYRINPLYQIFKLCFKNVILNNMKIGIII